MFYFIFLISITGCESQKTNFTLSSDIIKYTNHSLDLSSIIGSDYKIINTNIKERIILLKATKSDSSFFIGIDLETKKILFKKNDPFNDYVSSTFDVKNDTIFSLSSLHPSEIFLTNFKNTGTIKKIVDFEKAIRPGRIVLNQSQIFFINDVWGVGVISQKNFNKVIFHNDGVNGLVNPQLSTMSFPVDSFLNLLSGHVVEKNEIRLHAITNIDSIIWQYSIKQNSKGDAVSILNFKNHFVVKYDSVLVGLYKDDGKVIWRNIFNNSINEIYKWQDKILSFSLINLKGLYPDHDDFEYLVEFKLFDSNTGKELWSINTNSFNVPHIGICNNLLLLSDNKTLTVLSVENGESIEKIHFSKSIKNNYAFDMLSDIITGDHYLKSYDGKIYW